METFLPGFAAFFANMIIALLTDFGMQDYFVGAMKGVILSVNRNIRIIDISHDIPPQDIRSAAFTLRNCYDEFPAGTIFAAVVDPGVGSERSAILVESQNRFFIAPDNGLLSFIFNTAEDFRVFKIIESRFFRHPVSRTFHGRDIFAPAAAHLASGVRPDEFGPRTGDFVCCEEARPFRSPENVLFGEIIHADRFGNLITNLRQTDLPTDFALEIAGRRIENLQTCFAGAAADEIFTIFGSAGFLEIAAYCNSARLILDCRIGEKCKIVEK